MQGIQINQVSVDARAMQSDWNKWMLSAYKIQEQSTGDTEPLVDLETVVQVRVVDESFPADSGSWLLKVHAHDNGQILRGFSGVSLELMSYWLRKEIKSGLKVSRRRGTAICGE